MSPLTKVVNKHLLPIYDKPMIFYPISTLVESGIRSILIVTDKRRAGDFLQLLGSGPDFGARFTYALQDKALGIADALNKARDFVNGEDVTVILGDNIFFNRLNFSTQPLNKIGKVFLKEVSDPYRFGVARIEGEELVDIIEKPKSFVSNLAVTGIYQYRSEIFDMIDEVKPSERNELEITDVNRLLIRKGELSFRVIDDQWIDAGTFESLFRAQEIRRMHSKEF